MNFYQHDVEAIVEKIDSKKARSEANDSKVDQHKSQWSLLTMYTETEKKEADQSVISHANKQLFQKQTSKKASLAKKEPTFNLLGVEKQDHKKTSLKDKLMPAKLQVDRQTSAVPKQPVTNALQQVFSRISKPSEVASVAVAVQKKELGGSLFSRLKLGSSR